MNYDLSRAKSRRTWAISRTISTMSPSTWNNIDDDSMLNAPLVMVPVLSNAAPQPPSSPPPSGAHSHVQVHGAGPDLRRRPFGHGDGLAASPVRLLLSTSLCPSTTTPSTWRLPRPSGPDSDNGPPTSRTLTTSPVSASTTLAGTMLISDDIPALALVQPCRPASPATQRHRHHRRFKVDQVFVCLVVIVLRFWLQFKFVIQRSKRVRLLADRGSLERGQWAIKGW